MKSSLHQLRKMDGTRIGAHLLLWCPGCAAAGWGGAHGVGVPGDDGSLPGVQWEWDGNYEAPTISPSILIRFGVEGKACHSFVRAGRWEYLADCTHPLAGQTVDMVDLPGWLEH